MTTLAITGLVGVLGVVAGVFVERLAQRYGKLRFEAEPMRLQFLGDMGGRAAIHSLPVDVDAFEPGKKPPTHHVLGRLEGELWIEYKVSIELFNEKELPTGLRDIAIVFRGRGEARVETMPCYQGTWQIQGGPAIGYGMPEDADPVDIINLPSREWVRFDLAGAFNGHFFIDEREPRKLKDCDTVEFLGCLPNRRKFVRTIPINAEWQPWQYPL